MTYKMPKTGISYPEYLDEVEMRKYNRLNKMLKIQYALVPEPGEDYQFKKAECINISAGGMKMLVPELIEPGSQVVLNFILPMENNYSKLRLLVTVKRCDRAPLNGDEEVFHIGVEFANINRNELDIIINYTNTQKFMSNLTSMLTQKAKEK